MIQARIEAAIKRRSKKPGFDFSDAPDHRQEGKVKHEQKHIVNGLLLGLTANKPTLRDVEEMTQDLRLSFRSLVPRPISDTTLDTESRRLDVEYLTGKLVQQVREDFRAEMLGPVGLPCGAATVDGKNLATLDHDAGGAGHWRVENDCFNSLDLQWREDFGIWCTKGDAVLGLSLLRVMAYNLVQMLRRRRLRRKTEDGNYREPLSWRSLFKAIMLTLETALDNGEAILAVS